MYFFIKRLMDVFGSMVGIVIFSPLLLLTVVAIKLESVGPILVEESNRAGKNEKKFRMYKFRSMIADAHVKIKKDPKFRKLYSEFESNDFKLDDDPRITKVGEIIRRTSLDELPQFFNVLMGSMSLVGPRALYPEELSARKEENPGLVNKMKEALKVKPGMTGPWQVSGRSNIDFKDRISLDSDYAKKRSVIYDLLILLRTIPAVLRGKGAK